MSRVAKASGDSLLITAGIFAAADVIPLKWLLLPVMLCAIVGDQIGYWIGRTAGPALYKREDSIFFRRSHLQRVRPALELARPGDHRERQVVAEPHRAERDNRRGAVVGRRGYVECVRR